MLQNPFKNHSTRNCRLIWGGCNWNDSIFHIYPVRVDWKLLHIWKLQGQVTVMKLGSNPQKCLFLWITNIMAPFGPVLGPPVFRLEPFACSHLSEAIWLQLQYFNIAICVQPFLYSQLSAVIWIEPFGNWDIISKIKICTNLNTLIVN